jgi:hypothetical protein
MIRDLAPDEIDMGCASASYTGDEVRNTESTRRRMGYALSPIGIGSTAGPPMIGASFWKFVWWRAIVASAVSCAFSTLLPGSCCVFQRGGSAYTRFSKESGRGGFESLKHCDRSISSCLDCFFPFWDDSYIWQARTPVLRSL